MCHSSHFITITEVKRNIEQICSHKQTMGICRLNHCINFELRAIPTPKNLQEREKKKSSVNIHLPPEAPFSSCLTLTFSSCSVALSLSLGSS